MKAIIVGPDRGLAAAFAEHSITTRQIDVGRTTNLRRAGIETADVLILTDTSEATAVPVAKDLRPELRIVVYAPDSMPEFLRAQVDASLSPTILSPSVVVDELALEESRPYSASASITRVSMSTSSSSNAV
jgi:Trk K+ transport system NAD-binding subunit